MERKARARIKEASCAGAATDASAMRARYSGAEAPVAGVIALAEELGRLLARRELAKSKDRRAYALPELLVGASVVAVVWVLIARAMGWLAH